MVCQEVSLKPNCEQGIALFPQRTRIQWTMCVSLFSSHPPASMCRSCCPPGALPQSLFHRHVGHLRQLYDDTGWHIQPRSSHTHPDLACFCRLCPRQVWMQTCSRCCPPSLGTPRWNTFISARTSTSKTGDLRRDFDMVICASGRADACKKNIHTVSAACASWN